MSASKQPFLPPVPSPSNPVLVATQSQWIFTDAELQLAPSVLDGMTLDQEQTSRAKGVRFISEVGILLKLPQLTLATASVYLHRFFMRYSMVDLPGRAGMHPYAVAATSLFLATKVEENCRKLKEMIIACCRVAQKKPNLIVDEQSKDFWKWRDTILHNEDVLLEALCFDLQLEQPYRLLYDFMKYFGVKDNKPLRNAAWAFLNDASFTVIPVQFATRTIAASSLYAGARHCGIAFKDDRQGRPWWEQIDVDLKEIRRACNRMAELYERHPTPDPNRKYPTTPINGEPAEAVDKTRHIRQPEQPTQDHTSAGQSPSEATDSQKRERDEPVDTEPKKGVQPNTNGSSTELPSSQPIPSTESSPKRRRLDSNETDTKPDALSSSTQQQQQQQQQQPQSSQPSSTQGSTTTTTSNQQHPETATKMEPSTTTMTTEGQVTVHSTPSPPAAPAKDDPSEEKPHPSPRNPRIPAAAQKPAHSIPRLPSHPLKDGGKPVENNPENP